MLTQRDEIIEIANRLFIYTDERDWEKVKAIFANEVLFDMTSMAGGQPAKLKPQEIVDAWDKGLKNLKAIHHQVGNYLVTAREKDADLFCYGIAFHFLPNPTNVNSRVFVGSYNMHFVDTEGGWKIDRFKFNMKFIDGNKDLERYAE